MKVLIGLVLSCVLVNPSKADPSTPPISFNLNSIDPSTGLSFDPLQADTMCHDFYQKVIPLLVAGEHKNSNATQWLPILTEEQFASYLNTPVPGNPYRVPLIEALEFKPASEPEWQTWKQHLTNLKRISAYLVETVQKFLQNKNNKNQIIASKVIQNDLPSLYMRAGHRDALSVQHFLNRQDYAFNSLQQAQPELIRFTLSSPLITLLTNFATYHQHQIQTLDAILNDVNNQGYEEAMRNSALQKYFLSKRVPAHELIQVTPLQKLSHQSAEVIVLESIPSALSPHLNYKSFSEGAGQQTEGAHATAVAGIIAAKDNLEHIKGVAPGASIIHAELNDFIDPEALKQLAHSKARVINISFLWSVPRECAKLFIKPRYDFFSHQITKLTDLKNKASLTSDTAQIQSLSLQINGMQTELNRLQRLLQLFSHASPESNPRCIAFNNFVSLVTKKDMLVVKAAGNEALPLDKVQWATGVPLTFFSRKYKGEQYLADEKVYDLDKEDEIELVSFFTEIPELKNRFVVVGNLKPDGVTIASSSSLPGYAPEEFIYAPSDDIMTINPEEGNLSLSSKQRITDLNPFNGTSGAAPRVAGVFVLLGQLFPDLSMAEIKKCVLNTGDAFWAEPTNKYTSLQKAAQLAQYDLKISQNTSPYPALWGYFASLYGKGRINAMKAYHECYEWREKKRQKKDVSQDLHLITKKDKEVSP